MIRISLAYLYRVAAELEPLANLPQTEIKLRDVWMPLYVAQQALIQAHGTESIYASYLRSSTPPALNLLKAINARIVGDNIDFEADIPPYGLYPIKSSFEQYKIVFLAELASLDAYFVSKKGSHDTHVLLYNGEDLFPDDLAAKAPESVFDIKEAAKCLAFEIPTACGFHAFRALEGVLRRYYGHVTGGAAPPKVRNIGVYLNAMRMAQVGEPKVLASLKQIADLHRNPLIHPEAVLSTEEALSILGIARSVVGAMLAALPPVPQTTATPLIAAPAPAPAPPP